MSLLPFLDVAGKLIDKLIPDPKAKLEATQRLLELQQSGELQQMAQQVEINKIEAASPSKWSSGWRPGVGWTCVAGLAIIVVIGPLISWGTRLAGHPVDPPPIDTSMVMTLLVPMLGIGTLRSIDKAKGVTS